MLVGFKKEDIRDIVREIRKNKENFGHLPIIVFEAKSKDDLLWWISYFEEG